MINKYKNSNKELKQYRASRVTTGTASNGKPFTVFTISDSKKVEDRWVYDNYGVFSWQPGLVVTENDKVELLDIYALEVKETEYQGQKSLKKTIFADVRVVSANPQQTSPVEVIDGPMEEVSGDDLPF